MRILFDLRRVGLGNNGGSLTLIKSGNTLQSMGHDVFFIDTGKNKHTWEKLECEHMICRQDHHIPDADVIIATGYKSVAATLSAPDRCGLKVHWIRGWETWQMTPKKIIAYILEAPTIKLVNSIGLKEKLKSFNFSSKIIRPGYDLKQIYPTKKSDSEEKTFNIGGLYTTGKHEKIKRTKWIIQAYTYLYKKYGGIGIWMFGNENIRSDKIRFFHRPNMETKQYLYNNVDIWLSPATQEGLHMPPAEAMMAGAPVVGVDVELSGTHDYLIDGITGIVSKNDISSFFKNVEKLYLDKELRKEMGKRARKKVEEIGGRKANMQKMIDYFERII